MKILTGTDIIEIYRVKESIESFGEDFKKRVYTINEIKYCESKKNTKYQHYAARFAAKEAVFKAISSLLDNKFDITWKNIEIINNENGKPNVIFLNKNLENKIKSIDISISHCKEYATANVVLICK